MDTVIENYKLMDFEAKAKELDRVLFDFMNVEEYVPMDKATYAPIGYWDSSPSVLYKYGKRAFGLPAYVGHFTGTSNGTSIPGTPEGISTIPAVLGSSLVGIDKTDQNGNNFVDMLSIFYNTNDGMITDGINQATGASFWYEIYNQIAYCKLGSVYPDEITVLSRVISMADNWLRSIPYFQTASGDYFFEYTSFRFSTMQPYYNNSFRDSPNAGMSYIMLMAYALTGEEKYIDGARLLMDYLEENPNNLYYEAIQDYAPLVAAKMNFEFGTDYNVQRFIDQVFDGDSLLRPNWSVVVDDAGDYSFNGLVGVNEAGQSYPFLMNSYHLASTLVPTVKYDPRFATAIGRYMLNCANNIRVFYPNEVPAENQAHGGPFWADPNGSIGYEGCKKRVGDASPYATGDPTAYNWGQTNYGIYGSNIVGYFGAMIEKTDVEQILQLDLNACDFYGDNEYPAYLYYNPYGKSKTVTADFPEGAVLFDTVSCEVISKNAGGGTKIKIPGEGAVSVTVLPKGSTVGIEGGYYVCGGKRLCKQSVAVSITEPFVQEDYVYGRFDLITAYSGREKAIEYTVTIDGEVEYSGKYKQKLTIDSEKYSTDYHDVEVFVRTESGLTDRSRIRLYFNN